MKYFGLLILLGILATNLFTDLFYVSKTNLANLIQLRGFEEPQLLGQGKRKALVAKIYSTFPFNHSSLITVNAGSQHGVRVGMPVAIDGNFILGKVVEVAETISVVRTVHDKDFSLPVRLGDEGVNALLAGGQNPYLNLIEKSANISTGDLVYSAGKDFPYGLEVGKVGVIGNSSTDSFKKASLEMPYQINDLREAVILIDYVR